MVLGHHVWIRCSACSHSAVILPAVLAQLVGYGFPLGKLAANEVSAVRRQADES